MVNDRMIQTSRRKPTMEPMTIPAMAPPLSCEPELLLSLFATTVTVARGACLADSWSSRGRAMVGVGAIVRLGMDAAGFVDYGQI